MQHMGSVGPTTNPTCGPPDTSARGARNGGKYKYSFPHNRETGTFVAVAGESSPSSAGSSAVGGMAVPARLSVGFVVLVALALAARARAQAPAPAPTSDGNSIDQGIACLLMLVALVLTYLIHPMDASSYRLF